MARAARKPYHRMTTYISKTVAFDTPGIGVAGMVAVGTLPAGCLLLETLVRVRTAFNATTTNVIIVGTAADDDEFVEAGDVDEAVLDTTISDRSAGMVFDVDTPVYVQYSQTGTAATTGAADVVLTYIPEIEI